ncbi:MAG TPA: MarR family transcriptional regulator [Pararhizobium sp.]|nr:MarR family transcriptional regulator [Pararhizobium sp.]
MATDFDERQERRMADRESPGALADLEEALAFLVRGLEAVQRRRSYPLERAPYLLIGLIEREGPQTIGAAARRLLLDDSTVTRQVAVMVRHGLIRKAPKPGDARSIVLDVTAKGRAEAEAMRKARLKRLARLFRDWSEDEQQEGAKVLSRLNASLVGILEEPQP